jgi:hypothetical protein
MKYCKNKELCEYEKRVFSWERAVEMITKQYVAQGSARLSARISHAMTESSKEEYQNTRNER